MLSPNAPAHKPALPQLSLAAPPKAFTRSASALILTATALSAASLPARSWWLADVLANLRVQSCLALIAALIPLGLLKLTRHATAACLLLIWHASFLWTAFAPSHAPENTSTGQGSHSNPTHSNLALCLANVHFNNPNLLAIANSLQNSQADLLVVIELNHALRKTLAQQLSRQYPYSVWADRESGPFGIALLSRFPLKNSRILQLGARQSTKTGLPAGIPAILADVQTPAGPVHLIALHTMPPLGQTNFLLRSQQLALAASAAADAQKTNIPVILAGDLNLTPWTPAFNDLLKTSGLLNSARSHGLQPTWNAGPRYPCGLLIDHVLHSPQLTCTHRRILPPIGSDHRPLLTHFRISNPDPPHDSAEPSASRPYSLDPPPDTTP